MRKFNTTFILVFALLISVSSFAQDQKEKASLSIGGDIAFPTNSKYFKPGFGGTIKGAISVTNKMSFTLTSGYISFEGKKQQDGGMILGERIIPVRAGFQYKPISNLYIEPQVGYARINYQSKYGVSPSSNNTFNYAINIGYLINKNFELSARYEDYLLKGTSQLPNIGLRIAYRFKLW